MKATYYFSTSNGVIPMLGTSLGNAVHGVFNLLTQNGQYSFVCPDCHTFGDCDCDCDCPFGQFTVQFGSLYVSVNFLSATEGANLSWSSNQYRVIANNGYSDSEVFHGTYDDCYLWLLTHTHRVDVGENTFNCFPDLNTVSGYEENGDGQKVYYFVCEDVPN